MTTTFKRAPVIEQYDHWNENWVELIELDPIVVSGNDCYIETIKQFSQLRKMKYCMFFRESDGFGVLVNKESGQIRIRWKTVICKK